LGYLGVAAIKFEKPKLPRQKGKTMTLPRIMIGGTGSDCGKTTMTCAILQALTERGLNVAAFKCGPDYIDPMFHSRVIGAKSRNLDAFLCGRENITRLLTQPQSSGGIADIAVIEGVMGYYDGISASSDENSAANIARMTKTPSVLVVNPAGMSISAAAQVSGFLNFRENTVKAVLLNCVSPAMTAYYTNIIENETGLKVLGGLPKIEAAAIKSRHLGLVTANEIADLQLKIRLLSRAAADNIDLNALLELASAAPPLPDPELHKPSRTNQARSPVRVAVAEDEAFCFSYADSLDELRRLSAELVTFSPLRDERLPDNASGLILCGGYPELYLDRLSSNKHMLTAVKIAVEQGLPTIAECGGFMYLHERIDGAELVGVISGEASMTATLGRFGYMTLTAKHDNLLCSAGQTLSSHEFHYSASDNEGDSFELSKPPGNSSASTPAKPIASSIHASETLFAGYPHIHFSGNIGAAERFVNRCRQFASGT
jgi:cobyrinic acid a,c-diamide synthase